MLFINVQRTYGENCVLKLVAESILCLKKISDSYSGSVFIHHKNIF